MRCSAGEGAKQELWHCRTKERGMTLQEGYRRKCCDTPEVNDSEQLNYRTKVKGKTPPATRLKGKLKIFRHCRTK
jgi:hypothetical protein